MNYKICQFKINVVSSHGMSTNFPQGGVVSDSPFLSQKCVVIPITQRGRLVDCLTDFENVMTLTDFVMPNIPMQKFLENLYQILQLPKTWCSFPVGARA